MKFLFDFFPVLLFFIAYKASGGDMFLATAVIIGASALQVSLYWLKFRRVQTMHLITLALVAVFGGLTLLLQDEQFIKWKVSVVNWLFGVVFLGSQFVGEKNLVERMMSSAVSVQKVIWKRLNLSWALFFISMGFLNWYVMANYSDDIWVDFKFYGMLGLTFLFVIAQAFYLGRHIQPEQEPES